MQDKLTTKQKIFADEYLIDFNATRAYKVAYPRVKNDNTASSNASKTLRLHKVKINSESSFPTSWEWCCQNRNT